MLTPTTFLIPTDIPDVYDLHVDNSSKELFETCARAAEYYSVFRREGTADRPAQFFGSAAHEALAVRKTIANHPNFEQVQIETIIDLFKDHQLSPDEWRTCDRLIDVIKAYNVQWPVKAEPFEVVEGTIELPFKLLLGTAALESDITTHAGTFHVSAVDIYWTGRIDSIVNYGVPLVLDHKTTSVLGPTFFDDFVLSSQMLGYTWAARKLGYDVQGLLLDVLALRKPSRTGTIQEFQRQRYFYNQDHIDEWEKDTFTLIIDFLEHLCRGYFPKSTKWCFGKYGRCQYWDVCTQRPANRSAMLQSDLYKDVTWSPLNGGKK